MMDSFLARLEDEVPTRMAALHVPGAALAVIENRAVAAVRTWGFADREAGVRVVADTRFSLQSISKSFAAWAVMLLVEDGQVDLDRPVSAYLRRWRPPPSDIHDLNLVTPRRLLSHYAGVTIRGFRGVDPSEPARDVVDALQARLPPPNDEQIEHYITWNMEHDEPVWIAHPPGEAFRYSNAGFAILEVMIEDVTGEDYGAFVTRRIFRPLGLSNAGFNSREGAKDAAPYSKHGERVIDYRWPCRTAAGIFASVTDLARFALAEMAGPNGEPPGRGVLRPASIETMFTSHGPADPASEIPFETGLGHFLMGSGAGLNVHHSGGTIGWRSIYSIFPGAGHGFCMLMNGEAANDLWIPIVREWRDALMA